MDTRKVFTDTLGHWIDPNDTTHYFADLAEAAGLPATRLNDLRHYAASLIIGPGGSTKDAQTVLGHSSMSLAANTYSHPFQEQLAAPAAAAAAIVPRQAQG